MQAFAGPLSYLSGTGGRTYMGDCEEFDEAGIPVIWSRHRAVTGDSILSVIFDYEDPMSVVLAEPTEAPTSDGTPGWPPPPRRPAGGNSMSRVVVVGLGYVGLPLAVRAAEVGHQVVGVDVDPRKIERLRGAAAPTSRT